MTQDVRIEKNEDGIFDLVVKDSVIDGVDGFETAIIVSLLTDARAPASRVTIPSRRRGFIGDIVTADTGRQYGSILWTFDQSRLTDAILNDISVAAQEALNWMVEDGIAKAVTASAALKDLRSVIITVVIATIDGTEQRYSLLWRQTGAI